VRVRPASADDRDAIREVHAAAFGREDEARLALELDAVVSLVAVEGGGHVVGNLVLSRLELTGVRALALGPVAVAPAMHRRGIGSALVRAALDAARARGEDAVLLLGAPAYYERFGFAAAAEHGIDDRLG
jgi:putative acetyltransferase